jgi:hypothetical protein
MRLPVREEKPLRRAVVAQAIAAFAAGATFVFGLAADAPLIPAM